MSLWIRGIPHQHRGRRIPIPQCQSRRRDPAHGRSHCRTWEVTGKALSIAMPRYIPRLLAILPLLFFKAKYYTTFKILIVAHVYNEHWWAGVGWVYVNLIGLVWKCCNPNGFWLDMLAAKSIVFFPLEWPLGSIHSIPHFWKTLFSGATSAKSLSRNTSQAPSMLKSASRTCEAKVWTEVYRESWDPGWT